eukprot:Phypoly_transcript_04128.p1 GENE.Phypoly_transcript_04128~~Phypoly_transcript_04128.p1  ORF type:complete len:173 (+),score=15.08 Phypoly_transcript_04128:866-1384(+)
MQALVHRYFAPLALLSRTPLPLARHLHLCHSLTCHPRMRHSLMRHSLTRLSVQRSLRTHARLPDVSLHTTPRAPLPRYHHFARRLLCATPSRATLECHRFLACTPLRAIRCVPPTPHLDAQKESCPGSVCQPHCFLTIALCFLLLDFCLLLLCNVIFLNKKYIVGIVVFQRF